MATADWRYRFFAGIGRELLLIRVFGALDYSAESRRNS